MFSELFFGTVTQLFLRRQRERILVTLVGFFLAIVFLPASVQAEEFAVDTTAAANNTYSLVGAPAAVCISDTNCFVFYLDSGGDIEVASTTDSGLTWSSTRADSVNTTDAVSVGVWWDGWTPGTTTTRYIHIVTTDTGVDDTYYTRYDTQTHTLSTSVLATTQGAVCTQGTDCYPAITMASNGVLFIANSEGTDRWVVRCTTDCTTAVNWAEVSGGYQSTAGDDPSLLAPIPGTNNILLMWWDVSADALYYNIYSATSSSWTLASAVSIATAIEDNTTYDAQLWGMAIATTSGDIALVFTDDTNDYTTQDHDIRFYLYSSSTGWTAKTNPVTNAVGGITGAKVAYNPQDDVWYVVYARRSTIGTATTARIYYRYSSDDGTTWSEEQGPLNDVADEVNGLTVNITGYSRFGVWWNYLTSPYQDQLFYTPLAALHVPVTVSGVLYEADGVTPVATSETIKLVVGTTTPSVFSTSSAVTTGAFSVTGMVDDPLRSRVPLMLYIDGDVALPATAVTAVRNMTTAVTNFPLVVDDVTARTSVLAEVRASDFYIYDSADDSDLAFAATSSGGYVEVESGQEFVVATGTTFHMDAPLRLDDMTVATTATARASSTLTVTGSFTQNGTFSSAATTTWTARTAAEANSWRSVTYGNGLFVAVAYTGTNRVMTSPDGITWTARAAAEANSWSSVTYGNGLFVAVAWSGTNRVMTSPDGITWTARTAAEANQWLSVTYGNGLFVAVAQTGTNRVAVSEMGTLEFTGNSTQTIPGSLSQASGLGNIVTRGNGEKVFVATTTAASLSVFGTATTTFNEPLTLSGDLRAAAGARVLLASNATTTVQGDLIFTGTVGSPIEFAAETEGEEARFVLEGEAVVSYTTVSDNYACGSVSGVIDIAGGNNVDGGNTACWIFYSTDPALALAASAQFYVGQATTTLPTLVVTEAETPGITTANDIRLTIATTTTDFRFDTSETTPTIGGTAAGKVSGTVSYEDDGATLVVTVTENFAASDTLTLSGVAVGSFAAISTDASVLAIHTDGTTAGAPAATSTETFRITGLLAAEEHSAGQVENQFSWQNETDAPLFAFALTPTGENATVTDMVLTVSGLQGVETTELINFALYEDVNSDALLDGGDLLIDGAGIFTTNGQHGAVTFSADFLATTTRDYIVVGDTDGIDNDDALVFRLATTGVTAIGATSLFQPVVESTVSSVQHSRFRSGGGGGDSDRIGGAPPPGASNETGGGSGGGGDVGEEEEGENIVPDSDYYRPSATGETHNEWTNPTNAYASDGAYASAASTNLRQTYYGFAFNLPSGNTIEGISVKLDASGSTADGTIDVALSWDGGNSYTTAKATPTLSGSDVVYTVGGAADTWGRSWSTANFASEQFRLRVTAQPASNTVRLDALEVRVFHHASGGGSGGGGGI